MSRTILAGLLMLGAATLAGAASPSISARNAHVLVSKSDGTVVAWGSDVFGRLGTGRTIYRTTPQRLPDLPPIAQIAVYSITTLALDRSGRVWSWGRNDSAELGLRVQRNAAKPGRIQDLADVSQVATGDTFNAALKSDGTVWIWGATGAFASSVQGSSVPLRAVVIGQSPTGKVRFRQAFSDISSDINVDGVNAGVSQAQLGYVPPASGELAFVANYSGDALNLVGKSEIQYRGGTSLDLISNQFGQSAEFVGRYGSVSNSQFVTLVYQNVLGRAPDAAGLTYWRGQLDSGAATRGQVMTAFSESPEYRALIASQIYVTMIYIGMLRRAPDASGFAYWVEQLDKGNSGLALINGFLQAPEYRS